MRNIKKWLRRGGALLLCGVLSIGLAPRPAAASDDWQTLYKGELRRLLTDKTLSPAGDKGALAVLCDLNLDGVPELLLGEADSGGNNRAWYEYTITDGKAVSLPLPGKREGASLDVQNLKLYFNAATGESKLTAESTRQLSAYNRNFFIYEYTFDGKKIAEQTVFGYNDIDVYTGGQAVTTTSYQCLVDGKLVTVSKSDYQKKLADYYKGYELITDYTPTAALLQSGGGSYDAGQVDELLQSYTPCPVKAVAAQTPVKVDGKEMRFDIYNIGGNSYFKLRDLAAAINGTAKQYNVGWDNESRQVSIEPGKPYQPVTGEQAVPPSDVPCLGKQPPDAYVSFGGQKVEAEKYNINGNNYFKLRDLAELIDFGVRWNNDNRSILIDTTVHYSEN